MKDLWAPYFSNEDLSYFYSLLRNYFASKNIQVSIDDGYVNIVGNSNRFGLSNLAQICHQSSKDDWLKIIEDHFSRIFSMEKEVADLNLIIKDFEKISKYLAVKIYPEEYADTIGRENLVWRVDLPKTVTVLVFNMPLNVSSVMPEQIKSWYKSNEELFILGINNVKNNYKSELSEENLNKIKIYLCSVQDAFTATMALYIDEHLKLVGRYGSLVTIPNRQALICYPINKIDEIVDAISEIIPFTVYMEREGPGSISSLLYWYKDGMFVNLEYEIDDKRIDLHPPEEFLEIMGTAI